MRTATLHTVLAVLLVLMAATLIWTHEQRAVTLDLPSTAEVMAGLAAGFGIGVVAAVMGAAGVELLIPTIKLLYVVDAKMAGILSLAVSLPTVLVAFARYSRDQPFAVLRDMPGSPPR